MIVGTFTGSNPTRLSLSRVPRSKLKKTSRKAKNVNNDQPPFAAETRQNKTVKGNDGQLWTSLENRAGKWVWVFGNKSAAKKVLDCPHGMWIAGPTKDAPWRFLCDNEKPPAYLKRRSKSKSKQKSKPKAKSRSASPARKLKVTRRAYIRSDGTMVKATTYYRQTR